MNTAGPERITITVDGREIETAPDRLLIDVLHEAGIEVPTLCHDRRLLPWGGCRICLVERRDGRAGMVPACSTPVVRGMVIETSTPRILERRRRQLQLLLLDHRMECPVCERSGDCRLQDLVYRLGVDEQRLPFERAARRRDEASPVIVRDPEKCILCGRCHRLCDEIQGVSAIGLLERGLATRIATPREQPLDCEFCGQCVNACPVGALVARPFVSATPPWMRRRVATTCSICSCGCRIDADVHDGRIERVTADEGAEPNHGRLCARGWLGWDVLGHPDRLTRPLVRDGDRLVPTSWPDALDRLAAALEQARRAGRRIAAIAGSRLTAEDALQLRLLYREGLDADVALAPDGGRDGLAAGAAAATGVPRSSAGLDTLRASPLVLALRGDPSRTHPLVKTDLVRKLRQQGGRVILAHGFSGPLARLASRVLRPVPGREAALALGLAAEILRHDDGGRVRALEGAPGFPRWRETLLARWTLEASAGATGLAPDEIAAAARELANEPDAVAVVPCALGLPGDEAEAVRTAFELMAVVRGDGGVGRVLVLGEKAGLQGAIDLGLDSRFGPGGMSEQDRPEAEGILDAAPDRAPGVLHLVATDPAGSWPGRSRYADALARASFVVVQDPFLTATARRADLVLPTALLGERSGTLVGADGVARALTRVVEPPEGLPGDGAIFAGIAQRLGFLWPEARELGERLGTLLASADRPRQPRFGDPPEPGGDAARPPMILDVSPCLFHSGTTTERSRLLCELAPPVAVRISPADAHELAASNGDLLRVDVGPRTLLLRARIDRHVLPGQMIANWGGRTDSPAAFVERPGQLVAATLRRSK
ncbi:MAG: molybdopterin-dependent oxidoreductase [Acidobacteriota bacterium]